MKKLIHEIHRRSLWQVLGIYLVTGWIVLGVVGTLADSLNLPDWTPRFAFFLLIIGLPIVLATAFVQEGVGRREATEEQSAKDASESEPEVRGAHHRLFTWRNAILGGVLAFSLLFGFAGLYVVIQDQGRSFAPQEAIAETNPLPAVAVMPFEVQGEDLAVFREGMVSLLSTNLDGAAGLRATPSRTVLSRWKEIVGAVETADLETVLEVARRAGASYAVVGSAVAIGFGMRLSADLYDVDSGEVLGHAQVQGTSEEDVFALVDDLSLQIVRHIAAGGQMEGSPAMSLAAATTTSVDALKAFLEGEASYYRSDYDAAIEALSRAVEIDSTFAMANVRLANTLWWGRDPSSAIERALRHADRLPERERLFLEAEADLESPESREDELRDYVRRYPEDAEGWYYLGETYFHSPAALASAEETYDAFSRSVALAPDFAPAYQHLITLTAYVSHDSAHTAARVTEFLAIVEETNRSAEYDIIMALKYGDAASRSAAVSALDTLAWRSLNIYRPDLADPRYWQGAEPFMKAYIEAADRSGNPDFWRSVNNYRLAMMAAAGTGRVAGALSHVREADINDYFRAVSLVGMSLLGLPLPSKELDLDLDLDDGDLRQRQPVRAWLAWVQGDAETRLESLETLRRLSAEARDSGDSTRAETIDRRVRSVEKLGRIDPEDPATTLAAFGPQGDGNWSRWLVAQAYLDLDRPAEAIPLLLTYWPDEEGGAVGFSALANRDLGRAYEQLGEDEKAIVAYAFFIEAWKDADPELQPWVQAARTAITRLGPLDQ